MSETLPPPRSLLSRPTMMGPGTLMRAIEDARQSGAGLDRDAEKETLALGLVMNTLHVLLMREAPKLRGKDTDSSLLGDGWSHWLLSKGPLPISSYGIALKSDEETRSRELGCSRQSLAAATQAIAILDVWQDIEAGEMEKDPDEYVLKTDGDKSKRPMDMRQYHEILGRTRLPGKNLDYVTKTQSDHIVVLRNGHFFKVQVKRNGRFLGASDFLPVFKEIERDSSQTIGIGVSVLTSDDRQTWFKNRKELAKDNPESLKAVEEALFVMCLDQGTDQEEINGASDVGLANRMKRLRTGVSIESASNRWFDKSLQVVIDEGGQVGIVCEHSVFDGSVAMRFARMVNLRARLLREKLSRLDTHSGERPEIKKLTWKIGPKLQQVLTACTNKVEAAVLQSEGIVLTVSDELIPKEFRRHLQGGGVETVKINTDSYLQLAIQIAYYVLSGEGGSFTEPVNTRMFDNSRLDTSQTTIALAVLEKIIKERGEPFFDNLSRALSTIDYWKGQSKSGCGPLEILNAATLAFEEQPIILRQVSRRRFVQQMEHLLARAHLSLARLAQPDGVASNGGFSDEVVAFATVNPARKDVGLMVGYCQQVDDITSEKKWVFNIVGRGPKAMKIANDFLILERILMELRNKIPLDK